jgi:murein DD-endopeptidase MepM/ murein hydrolase activator NlpD
MASRVGDYSRMEAENARLRIDTRQLELSTSKLNLKISELENQTEKIAQIFESDAVFRRLSKLVPTAGGSRVNVSTADLMASRGAEDTLEAMQSRVANLENELSLRNKQTDVFLSVPTQWPLKGRIGSHYGSRLDPFTGDAEVHAGIDIVSDFGTAIEAPGDGKVIVAQRKSDYGNLVVLQHAYGITTRYGHLSKFNVRVGQTVRRGDIIGWVGLTGRTTAPHLHYEVRLNDRPENPRRYMR